MQRLRWLGRMIRRIAIVAILLGVPPLGPTASGTADPFETSPQEGSAPSSATQDRLTQAQQSAPFTFVENVGQFDSKARFQVRISGATIWLADDEVWITVLDKPIRSTVGSPLALPFSSGTGAGRFSNPASPPGRPSTTVPPRSGVRYRNLYPGLDLEVGGDRGPGNWRVTSTSGSGFSPIPADLATVLENVRLQVDGADGSRLIEARSA